MSEQIVTIEEQNVPAATESHVVDTVVINGQVVPDPNQVNGGVNSATQ